MGDEPDPVVVLMDLARWALDEQDQANRIADAARTEVAQNGAEMAAAAYRQVATELREAARWLDGDLEKQPVALVVGESRRAPDADGVPWRDADDE